MHRGCPWDLNKKPPAPPIGFKSSLGSATGTAWAGLCLIHHHHQSDHGSDVPMALAMRPSIPGQVSGDRAACDVKLRDTAMPCGIARKVELVEPELYDKELFPGEPQIRSGIFCFDFMAFFRLGWEIGFL